MYLKNKRLFLAGATGSVGANIIKHLFVNYPETIIRASCSKTKPYIKDKRIEYVRGDLRKESDCLKMSKGCDCAVMAAANTSGSKILKTRPWEQVNDNVVMNTQMLSAFYFNGVKRVVFISSATVYQEFEGQIKENQLKLDVNPHQSYFGIGWVMRYIEKLCEFWHQRGMEIIIARASNPFGPYSRFDPETSNFIPALIRKAAEKMDPFEIWGNPDVSRDVVYLEDFAKIIVTLLERTDIKFDIFNVGSGVLTTVDNAARWALEASGHRPSEVKYLSDKPTTIKHRGLDCSKLREVTKLQAQTRIKDAIAQTVRWWIDNKKWWER